MPSRVYVVLDADGEIVDTAPSEERAIDSASRLGERIQVEIAESDAGLAGLDELGAIEDMPQNALAACGIDPIDFAEVMRLPLEAAHAELMPFFPHARVQQGRVARVYTYETPVKMADALLGQNYKTAKGTPEKPSEVQGLSLLPHALAPQATERQVVRERVRTLCLGASPACKAACLVYSGRNEADIYNAEIKRARTE